MDREPAAPAVQGASPPPHFSRAATALWAAILLVLLAWFVQGEPGSPLARLERPHASLERLAGREMDFRHATRAAPAWERRLLAWLDVYQDDLEDLIAWYDELAGEDEAPLVRLQRGVLLGEAGRRGRVAAGLADLERAGEDGARWARWLQAAYLDGPVEPGLAAQVHAALSPGWFADALASRLASLAGERREEEAALGAIAARGTDLLLRMRLLLALEVGVLGVGALGLGLLLLRRPGAPGPAAVPPPWPLGDGLGLLVRGSAAYLAVNLGTAALGLDAPWDGLLLLLAPAPFLAWTLRLVRARGGSPALLGLGLPPGSGPRIAGTTLCVLALAAAGETLIGQAAAALGWRGHWTEGFPETLLWGSPAAAALDVLDSGLVMPLAEEVAFRGVLYASLRRRLPVPPAALLSAAVFALAHGYGPAGLGAVGWSGLLWALAYERTRSLWPALAGHALNNLLVALAHVALLRW